MRFTGMDDPLVEDQRLPGSAVTTSSERKPLRDERGADTGQRKRSISRLNLCALDANGASQGA